MLSAIKSNISDSSSNDTTPSRTITSSLTCNGSMIGIVENKECILKWSI